MSRLADEAFCVEYIKEIRGKDPGIGGAKLWEMYNKKFGKEHGVGYNRFYDILEKYNLKARKKKRRARTTRSEEDTSELQSRQYLVCRLLLEKKYTSKAQTVLKSLNFTTFTYIALHHDQDIPLFFFS